MTAGGAAFVTVGTDFHPFDRLISWVDRLAQEQPDGPGWLVQHGFTAAPIHAQGRQFLDSVGVHHAFADAPFVIAHGGPATVTEARRLGHVPIVVPRDPSYGEHVDDHQLRFARKMHQEGIVVCCETEHELRAAVNKALSEPSLFRLPDGHATDDRVATTVRRFAEIVDPLVSTSVKSPTVLFLGGFGRSGTTLFERLIGEAEGVCVLGEVVHLWERGLLANERCGCSLPFADCPQWQRIGRAAFGGWENVDAARVLALKARVDRNRFIPLVALPVRTKGFGTALREYVSYYERLYAAAAEVTGSSVVVDSSKHASLAFCLSRSSVDLRVLHVVRDSPGVTHSWTKRVRRPEAGESGDAFMPRYSAAKAAILWDAYNALFEMLRARRPLLRRVRYERLIAAPGQTLGEVADFAGIDRAALPVVAGRSVQLAASHTVAGNPMRFRTGTVQLTPDETWRTQMSASRRFLVAMLTLPLRVWYGYGGTAAGRRAH